MQFQKKVKRNLLLCLYALSFVFSTSIKAQDYSIRFETTSLGEVLQKAKQQKKSIFVDCYTKWCGPCKQMEKETFTQKAIAEYFNENFINVRVDLEEGEGPAFMKKHAIRIFPTLFFLDSNGEVIHRFAGYQDSSMLMEEVHNASSTENNFAFKNEKIEAIKKKYKNTNQIDLAEVANSLIFLRTLNMEDSVLSDIYFSNITPASFLDSIHWITMTNLIRDIYHPAFTYFLENKSTFEEKFGTQAVQYYIEDILVFGVGNLLAQTKNMAELEQHIRILKKLKPENFTDSAVYRLKLNYYSTKKDWKNYIKLFEQDEEKYQTNVLGAVNEVCWNILSTSHNKKLYQKLETWMKKTLLDQYEEDIEWLIVGDYKTKLKKYEKRKLTNEEISNLNLLYQYSMYPSIDTYANLLYKLDRKKEARVYAEKAVKIAKIFEQDASETEQLLQKL
ncbi:MAG: hypothetical protein RL582_1830 [Bacteroidota bacterium]